MSCDVRTKAISPLSHKLWTYFSPQLLVSAKRSHFSTFPFPIAFNSISASLWCHWSVPAINFDTAIERKAHLFSTVADFDFIINSFCALSWNVSQWKISHCLRAHNGVWQADKFDVPSARRRSLWCSSTVNETDGEKTQEDSFAVIARNLCWMETAHASQNKGTPSNDSETLITLDFYAFYSKTRARKSKEFSIIFLFTRKTKRFSRFDILPSRFRYQRRLWPIKMSLKIVHSIRFSILVGNYRTEGYMEKFSACLWLVKFSMHEA